MWATNAVTRHCVVQSVVHHLERLQVRLKTVAINAPAHAGVPIC